MVLENHEQQGVLLVVSAPSGTGKTSLVNALIEQDDDIKPSVSYTTRGQREGEKDGQDYYFVTDSVFDKLLDQSCFLEWAYVFGHKYATSRERVLHYLNQGLDVVLEIDWQGALQVSQSLQCTSIMIVPPSYQELKDRITLRAKDSAKAIEERLAEAKRDIEHYKKFDYVVVNDDFNQALDDLQMILRVSKNLRQDILFKDTKMVNQVKALERENQESLVQDILTTFS